MEGLYLIQRSSVNGKIKLFVFNSTLFILALLSILEPKQIKALFNLNIVWFYPQYIVLIFIALFLFFLKRRLIIDYSNIGFLGIGYLFSIVYIITTFINYNLGKVDDIVFSLQGLSKILIQYVFFITLIIILVDNYPKAIIIIMKSIFALSFIEILFILLGIISFETGLNLLPMQEVINNQIMHLSWIKVLNFSSFLPKFGGTFAETQELSLFLLISYISYELLQKCGFKLRKISLLWGKLLPIFILLTFSKTVIPALMFFSIWSYKDKKYLNVKLIITLLFITFFFFLLMTTYGYSLRDYYFYAIKADSVGERIFHIITFLNYAKDNILLFFTGMGPYNYGNYVQPVNPVLFNKYTNAISIFTVFIESGFFGFMIYIFLWMYIIFKSKNFLIKLSLFSLLVGNFGQPNWSMDILLMFIIMIYNLGNIGNSKESLNCITK